MSEIKFTCLHDKHVALGALMTPFGGFDMPIQYKGIVEEHNAVRNNVGVFDVSHMGEVRITGPEAQKFVNYIFTNDITKMDKGGIQYGMMLYPHGGTVDDLLVYTMGENDYFLVINAANIDKDVAWINEQAAKFDVNVDNQSESYGQIAVQGPEAENTMKAVLNLDCTDLTFYTFKCVDYFGDNIIVSRTLKNLAGCEVVADVENLFDVLDAAQDNFVVGGAEIFAELIPYATEIFLTVVDAEVEADAFFPTTDEFILRDVEKFDGFEFRRYTR